MIVKQEREGEGERAREGKNSERISLRLTSRFTCRSRSRRATTSIYLFWSCFTSRVVVLFFALYRRFLRRLLLLQIISLSSALLGDSRCRSSARTHASLSLIPSIRVDKRELGMVIKLKLFCNIKYLQAKGNQVERAFRPHLAFISDDKLVHARKQRRTLRGAGVRQIVEQYTDPHELPF